MKVLFLLRKNIFDAPGGDTIQILKTKKYLEREGVEVILSNEKKIGCQDVDLIHAFNLTRVGETYIQIKNAKELKRKIVLSPIYWPIDEFESKGRDFKYRRLRQLFGLNNFERIKAFYKYLFLERDNSSHLVVFLNGYSNLQKKIINLCDYFLPNSKSEIIEIEKVFGIRLKNYTIVPNGVDDNIFRINKNKHYERKYVLCVGRIDPRKNQLKVIKALNSLNYPSIFIGKPGRNNLKYYKLCRKIAHKNIQFIDYIDQQELKRFYFQSKVHVLASWFETPGLSSLEAAYCGCNIVVCNKGSVREYFKDYAYYCEPDDEDSIRSALQKAYMEVNSGALQRIISKEYTWEQAASLTLNTYHSLLRTKQ